MTKTRNSSKVYLNCVEIYNHLYRDYSEDVLKEPSNPTSTPISDSPKQCQTVFLTFSKTDLENVIGMVVGIDNRTLNLYIKWMIRFGFVKRINPHAFRLLRIEEKVRQQKLPLEDEEV